MECLLGLRTCCAVVVVVVGGGLTAMDIRFGKIRRPVFLVTPDVVEMFSLPSIGGGTAEVE